MLLKDISPFGSTIARFANSGMFIIAMRMSQAFE